MCIYSSSKNRQDVDEDSAQGTSPGISAVAGEGDLRVLGYLPDSQSLHVAGMYADVCSP